MAETTLSSLADLKAATTTASAQPDAPVYSQKLDKLGRAYATGKRKDAVARVWIKPGSGKITHEQVNRRHLMEVKSGKRARKLESDQVVAKADVPRVERMLGMRYTNAFAEDHVPSTGEFDPYMHVFLDCGNGNVLAFFELPNQPEMGKDPNTPAWVQHLAFRVPSENALLAAKAHIGYLPETPPLYRDLNVDEYLLFAARLHLVPRARLREAVARAQERCGLTDVKRKLIGTLSKGYQQRVGIAQAIVHEPDVIVLDEPTTGVDPVSRREFWKLLSQFLSQGITILMSTPYLDEAERCTRIALLQIGRAHV